MDGLIQITWWSAKQNNIENSLFLVHIFIFLSITLRKGGKFTINTAKCCLFRIIELQPGECLFEFLVETSFIRHVPFVREPSVVLETVLLLCHYSRSSISSSQNFRRQPFPEITIQGSLYLICTIYRLYDVNKPLAKDILRLCPDLHPTEAWLSCVQWNARFSCCLIMLVNISFRTINCSREREQNVMQKRNKCKIFNHRNLY